MTKLDAVDRVLELTHAEFSPSEADRARGRAALGLKPKVAVPPGAAPNMIKPAGSWAALRASGGAGLLAAAVLLGAGVGIGYWMGRGDVTGAGATQAPPSRGPLAKQELGGAAATRAPASERERRPDPPAGATIEGPASPVAEADAPSKATRARAASAQERTRPAPGPSRPQAAARPRANLDVVDELALLRRVERALRADHPALALALIGELEQRFPNSKLSEERLAAKVMANCGLGEASAALHAQRFLRDRDGSVYAERVRAACGAAMASEPSPEGSNGPGHE
jgi:hypothetical protein